MKSKYSYKKNMAKGLAAVMLGSILLTGCGNMIPGMTEEEEQAVGEYAAMVLLKYDANHRSRLVDLSLIEESEEKDNKTEEPAVTPPPVINEEASSIPVIDHAEEIQSSVSSISQFFGLPDGMTISYKNMEVCDSYPDDGQTDGFFSLDASSGKKLLVLEFEMTNNSGAEQSVDILDQNSACKITVNGSYTRTALMTMLTNDLSTYKGSVGAGETQDVVLLIEIDLETADAISDISLTLKNDTDTFVTPLM